MKKTENIFKKLLLVVLNLFPGKDFILTHWAKLPPKWKTLLPTRFAFLLHQCVKPEKVVTSVGHPKHIYITLPTHLGPSVLYGNITQIFGETGALLLANKLINFCDFFLDIGANHGLFTFFIGASNLKPIYSFEPNPKLFKELQSNLTQSKLANLSILPKAVGSFVGTTKFFVNLDSDLSSSLHPENFTAHSFTEIEAKVTTVDEFVSGKPGIPLIKVDVEGAEEDFIKGAKKTLNGECFLIIEFLRNAIKTQLPHKLIKDFGLTAYYINETNLIESRDGTFDYAKGEYNWLFCRKDTITLKKMLEGTKFVVK